MKNKTPLHRTPIRQEDGVISIDRPQTPDLEQSTDAELITKATRPVDRKTGILFVTSYPPRECGIATYSQDLIRALGQQFEGAFSLQVCALESGSTAHTYPSEVRYVLDTSQSAEYARLAADINLDNHIGMIVVQHEFGFFRSQESAFLQFLSDLSKPVAVVFHTVLPGPDMQLRDIVRRIAAVADSLVVMTRHSADILTTTYGVATHKVSVIPHGTHLVPHVSKRLLKIKYGLEGRKVLSTFGLLSAGKSIETTLEAMPSIVDQYPETVFLVIGKTHPEVCKAEGEKYRLQLERMVTQYGLQEHVLFVNKYVDLQELLEYLQLTDIYLFTSKDPNQAVSGTFSYAMSCACPIISTPIPHAREMLADDTGFIFDFCRADQLGSHVRRVLGDDDLRRSISIQALQKIVSTAWENSAVAHTLLFRKIIGDDTSLHHSLPAVNLSHLHQMTTSTGIIQFARINLPDIESGYTLDDNARALIALCMYCRMTGDDSCLPEIRIYLRFIRGCQQVGGDFLNYVDKSGRFTTQNLEVNLDDANGRAAWALGYALSLGDQLPEEIRTEAKALLDNSLSHLEKICSPRATAFAIKGLFYAYGADPHPAYFALATGFAGRLERMYRKVSDDTWQWFEPYLTYANSILPEAMLYAWLLTGDAAYEETAVTSLGFLTSHIFNENGIEVISNRTWLHRGQEAGRFGEQPIDVAYTIMTLARFYDAFGEERYRQQMETAFNWFLGSNRLHQTVYNPCTGGCYDGLEDTHVNLNQGAESTISYLLARLTMEQYAQA